MIARLAAKLLAGTYCLLGAAVLAPGLLVSALALSDTGAWSAIKALAMFLLIGGVPLLAGIALWRQKSWSRWLFLFIACLACIPSFLSVPGGIELYQHYKTPELGSYRVLSQPEFLELLTQFVLQPFWLATMALVAAAFTFAYFRPMPNPSIERTSPGKPGAASHVKR